MIKIHHIGPISIATLFQKKFLVRNLNEREQVNFYHTNLVDKYQSVCKEVIDDFLGKCRFLVFITIHIIFIFLITPTVSQ